MYTREWVRTRSSTKKSEEKNVRKEFLKVISFLIGCDEWIEVVINRYGGQISFVRWYSIFVFSFDIWSVEIISKIWLCHSKYECSVTYNAIDLHGNVSIFSREYVNMIDQNTHQLYKSMRNCSFSWSYLVIGSTENRIMQVFVIFNSLTQSRRIMMQFLFAWLWHIAFVDEIDLDLQLSLYKFSFYCRDMNNIKRRES